MFDIYAWNNITSHTLDIVLFGDDLEELVRLWSQQPGHISFCATFHQTENYWIQAKTLENCTSLYMSANRLFPTRGEPKLYIVTCTCEALPLPSHSSRMIQTLTFSRFLLLEHRVGRLVNFTKQLQTRQRVDAFRHNVCHVLNLIFQKEYLSSRYWVQKGTPLCTSNLENYWLLL